MVVSEGERYACPWCLQEELNGVECMYELRLHEEAGASARRTLPSVTARKVSINSSHFSTPSLSLISSSHDMASSTIA
jgi:hypothetical protein